MVAARVGEIINGRSGTREDCIAKPKVKTNVKSIHGLSEDANTGQRGEDTRGRDKKSMTRYSLRFRQFNRTTVVIGLNQVSVKPLYGSGVIALLQIKLNIHLSH